MSNGEVVMLAERVERMAYTPAELGAALGLSRKAIYRAIGSGELRAARICNGSRLVIPLDAVRDWIEHNAVNVVPVPLPGIPRPVRRRSALRPLGAALERLDLREPGRP